MRPLLALGFLIACHRLDADEPVRIEPVASPAPVDPRLEVRPAVTPVPPAPAPARSRWTSIEWRDHETVCLRDAGGVEQCRRMTTAFRGKPIDVATAPPDRFPAIDLTVAGVACSYRERTLSCPGESPITGIVEWPGGFHVYLQHGDTLRYFEPSHPAATLHAMPPLPGGIRQVSIGFRVGCALTNDDTVWCWSDPKRPRRAPTPPQVAEIMVQDPFELCVRTRSGEVHCSPPFVQDDSLICSKSSLPCGTGTVDKPRLTTSFDPLAKLLRPMRRLSIGHRALRLHADDDQLYQFCLDALAVHPDPIGGCTLGSTGEVSCFSVCQRAWRVGTVRGLPANLARIWSDDTTGYALAADGALWWWPRTLDCDAAAAATAQRANLPPVADLAPPFSLRSGPQSWDLVRCALLTSGEARCWQPGASGEPAQVFELK